MKFVEKLKEKNISTEDFIILVDLWVFSERDRKIVKRKVIDDITYEKLAHAIKNLDKVLENFDEEYSGRYPMYDNGYARGRSRDSMGRYSSRNGYSNGNDLMNEVRDMMSREPNESKRQAMQDFINRMSQF